MPWNRGGLLWFEHGDVKLAHYLVKLVRNSTGSNLTSKLRLTISCIIHNNLRLPEEYVAISVQ